MATDELEAADERTMNYGKENVAVFRTYATPLEGVETIPESSFEGRDNVLFGTEIRVKLEGEAFLPSFSEGDNSMVVATDSMKNLIHHQMGEYEGATLEGFLQFVSEALLDQYDHVEAVEASADEFLFQPRPVPTDDGYEPSDLVFSIEDSPAGYGELRIERTDDGTEIVDQTSGITEIELVKVKDNSFVGFIQDEYTTLPERENRTLYVELNIFWTYADTDDALGDDPTQYVPAEQVRDIAQVVFHELDVNSIQELIYQVGQRILERFEQLESVRFEANNRTWIGVRDDLEGDAKVLREPPRPAGFQEFSMDRSDLEDHE